MSSRRLLRGRRPKRPSVAITLSDEHRAWIVENAVRGLSGGEMLATLVAGGVPRALAEREIGAILASPAMPGCRRLHRRAEQLELVARLLREVGEVSPHAREVERRVTVGAEEMLSRYVAGSRPVVLTGMLADWPARRWTPELLAERLRGVEVEVVVGRGDDPAPEKNHAKYRRVMAMERYVEAVRAADAGGEGAPRDLYMVAHNRVLERAEMRSLLDDLTPPEDLFDVPVPAGTASLWFGPGGTFTPLHHDTSNILICQMYGKKRFDLVSPLATSLLERAPGFYAGVRAGELDAEGNADARVLRVELDAGEALLLPAGWWHEVTALTASIHVSLMAFKERAPMGWYLPGAVR